MLEGKVCAAIHWMTKCSGGGVLKLSDSTTPLYVATICGAIAVLEVLGLEHPDTLHLQIWFGHL